MFTASEVLDLAIQVEVNGEDFYRLALRRVAREPLREMLGRFADQEVQHRIVFQKMRDNLCSEQTACGPLAGISGSALKAAMGRHAFSLDELEVGSITDVTELIQAAVEFEQDSIQFYEFLASIIVEPQALFAIQHIRGEELDHKRLLLEILDDM